MRDIEEIESLEALKLRHESLLVRTKQYSWFVLATTIGLVLYGYREESYELSIVAFVLGIMTYYSFSRLSSHSLDQIERQVDKIETED